jgi:hypothetical protein
MKTPNGYRYKQLHVYTDERTTFITLANGIKFEIKLINSNNPSRYADNYIIKRVSKFDISHLFNYEIRPTFKHDSRGNNFYLSSGLYTDRGTIHTDRRLTMIPRMRTTQGLGVLLTYGCETLTSLANAFTYYLMYKSGKNIYHTVKEFKPTPQITNTIKDYLLEIIGILSVAYRFYIGKVDAKQALFELTLVIGAGFLKSYTMSFIMNTLRQSLVHSTSRETQVFEPVTLAQNIISILIALGLGTATSGIDAKSVLSSIKSLGSTLLTVKTVESVFVTIISFLPDIMQKIMCIHVPAFALYIRLTTDNIFKNNVTVIHRLKSLGLNDILYNSHNLAQFINARDYFLKFLKTEVENHVHLMIPEIITFIDDTYDQVVRRGLAKGNRKMPYVIWVSGDPGVGKSAMVYGLARELLKKMMIDGEYNDEDLAKYIFSHNTSNKYFDGYNNQPIFVLNDYLQFALENEEQWLIRFTDTVDCPLEVSSVDNIETGIKGEVRFTSQIIIVTSNMHSLAQSATLTNCKAFNRRRDFVLDMTFKPHSVVTEDWNYNWCNFRRLSNDGAHKRLYQGENAHLDAMLDITSSYCKFCDFSKSYDLTHIEQKKYSALMSVAEHLVAAENYFDKLMDKVSYNITHLFDKEFFGINFKYLLPLISGSISAVYLLYKGLVPYFSSKFTQSLSGDSGTAKIKQVMKPIIKTTMGISQNNMDVINKINNNFVRITVRLNNNDFALSQTMWGWAIGGSLIVTPKHLWRRGNMIISEGNSITVERGVHSHDMIYKDGMLYLDEDSDYACLNILGTMPQFRATKSILIDQSYEIKEAGEDIILVNPTMNKDGVTSTVIELRGYITDAMYKDDAGLIYEGRNIWQYNHRFMKGDCGSILLIQTQMGVKVAGMHVAGDSFSGNSEVITTQAYDKMIDYFTKTTQGFTTDIELDQDEYFDAISDLEEGFYFLGKAKRAPFQNNKTDIVKSPFYEVLQPVLTGPSVLSPSDSRLEEPVSPILKSVSKYGVNVVPFSEEALNMAYNIVKDMYDPINAYELKVTDHNNSINAIGNDYLEKLDISTSAGYPWNVNQKSKKDLIDNNNGTLKIKQELQDKLNKCENLMNNNIMFPYTLTTTLKDERVSLEKIKIGKTRTFMNFPVEYTILMRKYFDSFIDKETKHALDIGTTVGVNIYSSKWQHLYTILKKYDFTIDGDYKAFDGTIRPEFFRLYARLVNSFYKDEHIQKRDLLVTGCCFAPIFVLDKVYVKLQGNPSGSRITTSFNSFVNRMYVVMSLLSVLPEAYHTPYFINNNLKIFAHGDDHIVGFNKIIESYWNGHVLRDYMMSHNIGYTSSQKDGELPLHRPLHDCYYLKSYFVYDKISGTYRAGLDKLVIQEMVSWQRDREIISTKMICNTALRYAYFWGEQYFNRIRNNIVEKQKQLHMHFKLIDYISLDIEYRHNGELIFDFTSKFD